VNAPVGLGLPPLRFMERGGLRKYRERSHETSKRCSCPDELHYTAGAKGRHGLPGFSYSLQFATLSAVEGDQG
jgi:hypothetical protein